MKKTIIAAALLLSASQSALAGNCQPVYPAKAGHGEILTITLPGENNKGMVSVAVYTAEENARIGGSATTVRWCESNRRVKDAGKFALVYTAAVDGNTIEIPVAHGDAWIRVYAGKYELEGYRSADANELRVNLVNQELSVQTDQKKEE